ncbi:MULTISPECIES: hypothetical protein [unclassified Microbacterium]|uniref:hypothetical protein n=1 Tax=unclassified Microbacterium TaxID=2609290 RepID=UPI00214C7CB6|nr:MULTISPECIES: hypothetical protein [unclassified Microbacterium]MCR2808116.1 hypothetical protein [Microbacterium sp. zg.B185]WIM19418.1 hypothetical protein QNO12_00995 [Microbacterium sp. zg-B185]
MSAAPPRRRLSPAVYRRRRLVLLLALMAAVALVWVLIAQPWRGASAIAPDPTPTATQAGVIDLPVPGASTPTPSETPTAEAAPDAVSSPSAAPTQTTAPTAKSCMSRDVTVEPLTDQDGYDPGQNPQLSIRLTNNGAADCTINVGTSTQAFTIVSGSDVWWRSTDCQTEPSDMLVLLAAGQSVSSAAPLTWDRSRSSVDDCGGGNRQTAPGDGASYHLSVEIGGIPSMQSKQIFLY